MTRESSTGAGHARRPLAVLKVLLAWGPLYVLWILFVLSYDDAATLPGAAFGGLVSIGLAAVLGFAVWAASGRLPWPDRLRIGFYVRHLALGSVYSAVWVASGYAVAALRSGNSFLGLLAESRVLGWQFILGLVLYGLVAGVSYALRIRERLVEQERIAANAEALADRARLTALRARVNPHFLFNALHTVGALVREDPAAAERSVERLGDLLRHALNEGREALEPLATEWEFTRAYVDLERLRFGDRLRITTDLESDVLAQRVPPLTLQPIVENVVRHAVERTSRPVEIRIVARQRDGGLEIEVSDDGPGASPVLDGGQGGFGLAAVRERLRAICGPGAAVEVTSTPGAGFRVRLFVPAPDGRRAE
ncbi:MAG: histidine kinase [Gemmatimonadales bacterium]|jgi:signal transduction histidine kinase